MVTTSLIKISADTKQILDVLKVMDRETYDGVIQRLIQHFAEDQLELNIPTQDIIEKRLKEIQKGKVISIKEVLKKMREQRNKNAKRSTLRS